MLQLGAQSQHVDVLMMATQTVAQAIGISNHETAVGRWADLVMLQLLQERHRCARAAAGGTDGQARPRRCEDAVNGAALSAAAAALAED